MLTPSYLETLGDEILPICEELIDAVIYNTCSKFNLNNNDLWKIERVTNLIDNRNYIRKKISDTSNKLDNKIENILKNAINENLDYDFKRYKKAYEAGLIIDKPINIIKTKQGIQIFESILKKTKGETKNLTNTLLNNNNDFIRVADKYHNLVATGFMNSNTASRKAVLELSEKMGIVIYPSGHRDHLDTAVWRAIRTGASQTAAELSMMNFEMMGGNLLKTTAHLGARPEHILWQGETFWVNTPYKQYRNFYLATQYGKVTGLEGINCRHSKFPVFEELDDLSKTVLPQNLAGVSEEEFYWATQNARAIERKIKQLKRNLIGFDASNNKEMFKRYSYKLKDEIKKYKVHMEKYELMERKERMQVVFFDKRLATKSSKL